MTSLIRCEVLRFFRVSQDNLDQLQDVIMDNDDEPPDSLTPIVNQPVVRLSESEP
ncbi:hypothetical protein CU097_010785, partial [Rhizopus azygosporus]